MEAVLTSANPTPAAPAQTTLSPPNFGLPLSTANAFPLSTFPYEDTPSPPASPTRNRDGPLNARSELWIHHYGDTTHQPNMAVDDHPQLEQSHPTANAPPQPAGGPQAPPPRGEERTRELPPGQTPLRDLLSTHTRYTNGAGSLANDPLDNYTRAEMPKVQDAFPNSIYENISPAVFDEWESYPGGKLAAVPFDLEAKSLRQHDSIRGRIFSAASEITESRDIAVAAPIDAEEDIDPDRVPSTFLIYNLTATQRETLLRQSIWASASVTFRVTPLTPTHPDFLFAIMGFTTLNLADATVMVKKVWKDEKTQDLLQKLTIPMDVGQNTPQPNLRAFTDSMYIKLLDIRGDKNALRPHYNIHADNSLIPNPDLWCQVRALLARRSYFAISLGRGVTRFTAFKCTICHGADHPRGLCPFTEVPGWKGPTRRPANQRPRGGSSRGPSRSNQWN